MFNSHFIIKEDSLDKIANAAWHTVTTHGKTIESTKGYIKAVNSVNLVWENPMEAKDIYSYWDRESIDWYLNIFVRPNPFTPESENQDIIFPFTYAWRSRYHDLGWGYAVALVRLLRMLNYSDLPFSRREDVKQLIRETYHHIHPDVVLAVLAWLRRENLLLLLINDQIGVEMLKAHRVDMLSILLKQITSTPTTRKAITPSFLYSTTDIYGLLEYTPAYQNYQIVLDFDKDGNPVSFESFHLHRALNADGSIQLDLLHDLEWGNILSRKIGLPLTHIHVHANQLFTYTDDDATGADLGISDQLLNATGAYIPSKFDIDAYLNTKKFNTKIDYALKLFERSVTEEVHQDTEASDNT